MDFEEVEKILFQPGELGDEIVNAIVKRFAGFDAAVIDAVYQFSITCQRMLLCLRLQGWMPERVAMWLVNHWPERWLPAFDADKILERMEGENQS